MAENNNNNSNSGYVPGLPNLSNSTYRIKDGTAGSTPTYPLNTVKSKMSPVDFAKAAASNFNVQTANFIDNNSYGKPFTFDNSPSGPSFVARYKGYGQETYNKLGFDPTINNESWYNENTSQYDDFKRMITHSAWPMLKLGFISPIKSYGKLLGSGDVNADLQEANDYQKYSSIGYSTKGGVGGFTTNLFNSAAYSAGILTEGLIEGVLVGATVGAFEGGVGAIPGAIFGGIAETASSIARLPGALMKSAKNITNMSKALADLSKISNAKNFFTNAGTKLANFANPLGNTTTALKSWNEWKNVDDLTSLARSARTAGAFWNDVKNINMALSEGRLEGGFSEQAEYKKLYDEHYAKFGVPPTNEEQGRMMQAAKSAGFTGTAWNTALVFYSNKIAFPTITRAGFLKNIPRASFGKTVGQIGKEYQIMYNAADKFKGTAYSLEKIGLRNTLKAVKNPKKWGSLAANYFRANLVEGLQEVGQEAIASAVEKYYHDAYHNPNVKSFTYGLGALGAGIDEQISTKGLEVFASGFAMGSILSGPLNTIQRYSSLGYNKYFKHKNNYDGYIKEREAQGTKIVEALNNLDKNAQHFFDPRIINYANIAKGATTVDDEENFTIKDFKDTEHDTFFSAVNTAIRTGTFDMFLDNYKSYKEATPEELEEAWSLEPGQGKKALRNIDRAVESAKVMSRRHDYAVKKFGKYLVDPSQFKEGTIERKKAVLQNKAFGTAITNLTFYQSAYDNSLQRLNKLYNSLADISVIAGTPFSNVATLTDSRKLNNEINLLIQELTSMEGLNDPSLLDDIRKKQTLLEALVNFKDKQEASTKFLFEKMGAENLDEILAKYADLNTDPDEEYRDSYIKVLRTLANLNNQNVEQYNELELNRAIEDRGGEEAMFNDLYDTEILKNEMTRMNEYINLLNDPDGFKEHLDRNFAWMQKMYNDRKEYYKGIVNQEINNIENNEILTDLASKGVYVDLEQFADWVENNENYPDYFIDEVHNMIIDQNSELYLEYLELFTDSTKANKKPAGEPLSDKEKLDKRIQELEDERSEAISLAREAYNKALKDKYGRTEEEILSENERLMDSDESIQQKKELEQQIQTIEPIVKVLKGDDVNAIVDIFKDVQELVPEEEINVINEKLKTDDVLYRSTIEIAKKRIKIFNPEAETQEEKIAALNNAMRVESYIIALTEKLNTAKQQLDSIVEPELFNLEETPEYKTYQEELSKINTKYDDLINEEKEGSDDFSEDDYTTDTPYDELPEDLKGIIDDAVKKMLPDLMLDFDSMEESDYIKIRNNWIQQNPEIFEKYNKERKEKAAALAKKLAEPPFLKLFKVQISASDNLEKLDDYVTFFTNIIKNGTYKDTDGKDVKASPVQIETAKEDLEKLKGYLDARAKAYRPQNMAEETFRKLNKNLIQRQKEIELVYDEDGKLIGRRFAGEETTTDIEKRTTKVISSETVEKGIKKGQTRTVTQTNSVEDIEGTPMSVTEYEAKVGETKVTSGGRTMTFKEFKEEFPLDEDYEEILGTWPDLNDDTIITVRKVKRTPTNSRFETVVNIFSSVLGGEMDITIKKDDTKYDAELDALGKTTETSSTKRLAVRPTSIADKIKEDLTNQEPYVWVSADENATYYQEALDNKSADPIAEFMVGFRQRAFNRFKQTFGSEKKLKTLETTLRDIKANTGVYPTADEVKQILSDLSSIHKADTGTKADVLIRTMLTPQITGGFKTIKYTDSFDVNGETVKVKDILSKEAYDSLFEPGTGVIARFRQYMVEGDFRIFPENLMVFDKNLFDGKGIIGEMDLLALSNTGKLKIIDIKLSSSFASKDKKDGVYYFEKENSWQKTYFRAQQSIYGTLMYNMIGIKPDIAILPLNMKINADGFISKIELAPFVEEGKLIYNLEYLPEIADYGVVENYTGSDEVPGEKGTGVSSKKPTKLQESEDENDTNLRDNIGKTLMFQGNIGELVQLPDGTYAIKEQTTSETIDTLVVLSADLEEKLSKMKPDEPNYEGIKKQKEDIDKLIENRGVKETTTQLTINNAPVTDGNLRLSKLGLKPLYVVDDVNQVRFINGKLMYVKYNNRTQTKATINGVNYTVNRDINGSVISLEYDGNQKRIDEIDDLTTDISYKIENLSKNLTNLPRKEKKILKNIYLKDLVTLKKNLSDLKKEKENLLKTTNIVTISGGNNNDIIFALNTLPSIFVKNLNQSKPNQQELDTKTIGAIILNDEIPNAVASILDENYPVKFDDLLEKGVSSVNDGDLLKITLWAKEVQGNLDLLKQTVRNRQDLVDYIDNIIAELNQTMNEIGLIKLNKDGKISKKQPKYIKEFFGPKRISDLQERSDIPNVQGTDGESAEGVLRQATEEELEELIRQINPSILEQDLLNESSSKPAVSPNTLFEKANLDNIDTLLTEAVNNMKKSGFSFNQITEAYDAKLAELNKGMEVTNLKPGTELKSKVPIFTEGSDLVEVVKLNKTKKQLTVKLIGTNKTKTISETELKENFMQINDEALKAEVEKPEINTEELNLLSDETNENIQAFSNNADAFNDSIKKATETSKEDLMKKIIVQSSKC